MSEFASTREDGDVINPFLPTASKIATAGDPAKQAAAGLGGRAEEGQK